MDLSPVSVVHSVCVSEGNTFAECALPSLLPKLSDIEGRPVIQQQRHILIYPNLELETDDDDEEEEQDDIRDDFGNGDIAFFGLYHDDDENGDDDDDDDEKDDDDDDDDDDDELSRSTLDSSSFIDSVDNSTIAESPMGVKTALSPRTRRKFQYNKAPSVNFRVRFATKDCGEIDEEIIPPLPPPSQLRPLPSPDARPRLGRQHAQKRLLEDNVTAANYGYYMKPPGLRRQRGQKSLFSDEGTDNDSGEEEEEIERERRWWSTPETEDIQVQARAVMGFFAKLRPEYATAASSLVTACAKSDSSLHCLRMHKDVREIARSKARGLEQGIIPILRLRQRRSVRRVLELQSRLRCSPSAVRSHLMCLRYQADARYASLWAHVLADGDAMASASTSEL